jgi:hypothetical protein
MEAKMKRYKFLLVVLILSLIAVVPASAQLGESDFSTFTIMNVSDVDAQVEVMFVDEAGATYTPSPLATSAGDKPNPFTMAAGEVVQVAVFNIDTLPDGPLSVVISSSAPVVAQAGVASTGAVRFSGSYAAFSTGSTTVYIPSIAYNYFDPPWYSMVSVQNIGGAATDILMTITCSNGTTGTLLAEDVPVYASHTWALKLAGDTPTGFTTSTECEGSAVITAAEPIIAVNNQNRPTTGATNSFEGSADGFPTLYAANLSNNYAGWLSALTIQKLDAGDTLVTVDYGGPWANSTCNLTDAVPSCKLIMPVEHGSTYGRYGAKIYSDDGTRLLALAGSTKNGILSNGVNAFATGATEVAAPNVTKYFYGFISAVTCVNVSTIPTTINVLYEGYATDAYDTGSIAEGESVQIVVRDESFLPDGFQGGATLTANTAGALIACQVGNTKVQLLDTDPPGDWTVAFPGAGK